MIPVVIQGQHGLLRIQSGWRCEVPLSWKWDHSIVQKALTTKAAKINKENYR